MQLYSFAFILFLSFFLVSYYLVGRFVGKGQWVVLLVASLSFYAICGWKNLVFILGTTFITWIAGMRFAKHDALSKSRCKGLERADKLIIKKHFRAKKRVVLALALLACFGILAYIKYWNVVISYLSLPPSMSCGILLPLGISFYTFQSASYVIDTYSGKYEPERNLLKYALFVSFFPQLIQGPINRFDSLATQLYEHHSFDITCFRKGLLRIGYGALKKFAIANVLVGTVNSTFNNVNSGLNGSIIVFAIIVYAIYQYADFSGGIDMVLGIAQLFGVQMAENFRQPYFSVSLGDFWRRWHITLGAWMRDYVFYPFALLPGVKKWGKSLTKRFGKHFGRTLPACIANIIVFFIVGLWHGAESHFILWGLYNGLIIAASDLLTPVWERMNKALHVNTDGFPHHVFCIVRTFIIVCIGWYFDRIESFTDTLTCFYNTVFHFDFESFISTAQQLGFNQFADNYRIATAACLILFIVSVLSEKGIDVRDRVLSMHVIPRFSLYVLVIFLILVSFSFAASEGFMYANY